VQANENRHHTGDVPAVIGKADVIHLQKLRLPILRGPIAASRKIALRPPVCGTSTRSRKPLWSVLPRPPHRYH